MHLSSVRKLGEGKHKCTRQNGMDLQKQREWQEYTSELYKDPHDSTITRV